MCVYMYIYISENRKKGIEVSKSHLAVFEVVPRSGLKKNTEKSSVQWRGNVLLKSFLDMVWGPFFLVGAHHRRILVNFHEFSLLGKYYSSSLFWVWQWGAFVVLLCHTE